MNLHTASYILRIILSYTTIQLIAYLYYYRLSLHYNNIGTHSRMRIVCITCVCIVSRD